MLIDGHLDVTGGSVKNCSKIELLKKGFKCKSCLLSQNTYSTVFTVVHFYQLVFTTTVNNIRTVYYLCD